VPRLFELYPGICLTTEEKARKTSVRVVEKCPDIPVAAVQYTKQYTEQHNETEYTERNMHNNKTQNRTYVIISLSIHYSLAILSFGTILSHLKCLCSIITRIQ
jgi:hypothetical protein